MREVRKTGIIIADAGSTKTDWLVLEKATNKSIQIQTGGINPSTFPVDRIIETVSAAYAQIPDDLNITEVYFYGAGCGTTCAIAEMEEILRNKWQEARVSVESDLKGAAISLFGNGSGLACILGTGSSTCLYQNRNIIAQISSLGYILGDEGSGSALGKRLLNGVFKQYFSKEIISEFQSQYNLSVAELIQKVYKDGAASSFFGSFVPFISNHLKFPEIRNLVKDEFVIFFKHNILPYQIDNKTKIGFVGSIALVFQDILKEVAEEFSYDIARILKSPIEGLKEYHLK